MTSKLIPSDPESVMVIRDIAPNVTTLSVPFLRFGRIKIGGRATIVKLQSGSLAIFSPVALTPTVQSKLSSITPSPPTTYLIAPDMEHHIFLSSWATHYPRNHIIAPAGLKEKRLEQSKTDPSITPLDFKTEFTKENKYSLKITPEFDAEFSYEFVDAHPNKELVFVHHPSRTLIEADLIFNLPAVEQYSRVPDTDAASGWATKLFGGLQNTRGDAVWQKRMLWYAFGAKDRVGFGESMRRIGGWGFENLVPCHGETVLGTGKETFRKVAGWYLDEKK
ncbi:uncharacterized protein LY89DRAFT_412713 [Mollisia scopiformis]|uniref:DUF4336 domain-containing protein n=1 Tax=Mollisia scopiformis TaxID=149040 RepID=A0A132B1X3_MOLSC|nr:uncharacterized protein LY89DRAFT_412713 [Mollisia scopiformis]KUJ06301.1 hypothetical protein LY89DRAFT_412713 [Mollisia scopiformis]